MADQKNQNQNQGSQRSERDSRNPQGQQSSQQPTSSTGNTLRDKDEQKRKDALKDRDRSGAMDTRNEELETPEGRSTSNPRAEEEDIDELGSEEKKRRDRL